jgi:exopolyphosphatase / guanosine-5'-triphosphate,3'-diphosphate pyrophosphatase
MGGMTRVAALDCGTNSVRLLVSDVDGGGAPVDVLRRMEITRLGQGVDATGRLDPAALARTGGMLTEYAEQIRELGAERVRLVATSATRDAANRDEFAALVRASLGIDPEVITGTEEAELSFAGAVAGLPAAPPYLVCDIGGGSTELVLGEECVHAAYSMDIGCVRLTERHLRGDPPTPAQIAAAEADIRAALEVARRTVPVPVDGAFVGLAGSVTTVAALALDLPAYDPERIHHTVLRAAQVADVTGWLLAATRAERAARPVMHPGRVDVIGAGALILRTLMTELARPEVVVSEHDILDGLVLSLANAVG